VLELVGHVLVPMVDGIVEVEVIHMVHIEIIIIVVVDQGKTKVQECVPSFLLLLLMFVYPVMKFMSIEKGMILFNVHLILILVDWWVFGWFLMMF
jgi:hypothetical protein